MNDSIKSKIEKHFAEQENDPMRISTALLQAYELHRIADSLEYILNVMELIHDELEKK